MIMKYFDFRDQEETYGSMEKINNNKFYNT